MSVNSGRSSSFIHGIDSRVKIIILFCLSLFSVMVDSAEALVVIFALVAVFVFLAKIDIKKIGLLLILMGLLTWGTMFSQALFYFGEPRTVLINLVDPGAPVFGKFFGELNVYREGFKYGAVQSLRFSFMLMAGLIFVWTTEPTAMLVALMRLKIPYTIAFMAVTAVNFLPTIIEEVLAVRLALSMRGGGIFSFNPFKLCFNALKLIRPVFINCYRRSNILALTIQGRAFNTTPVSQMDLGRNFNFPELVLLACVMLVTATLVFIKIFYWLYLSGLYYHTELRPVYEFCRYYL